MKSAFLGVKKLLLIFQNCKRYLEKPAHADVYMLLLRSVVHRRFKAFSRLEPCSLFDSGVAQLVRAPSLSSQVCWFDARSGHYVVVSLGKTLNANFLTGSLCGVEDST